MDNKPNVNDSASKGLPGCVMAFVTAFIALWAVVFFYLGVNFLHMMTISQHIASECLDNGNCPKLEIVQDGRGNTVLQPEFPAS
jgi:hypothetical protein